MNTIQFRYMNHQGEVEDRSVDVDSVEFHYNPGFGHQPGWFISGYDNVKNARRSFALSHIVLPEGRPDYSNTIHRLFVPTGVHK